MAEDRLAAALDRIERALARLEAGGDPDQALRALEGRHAALRTAAREALAGLDGLLEPAR